MRQRFFFILPALALLNNYCSADLVYLKNGKTLNGEVIKEDDDWVVVRVPSGEVKLRATDVDGIERQTAAEYKQELGKQLLLQERYDQAIRAFEDAYLADKNSGDGKRLLCSAYLVQAQKYTELNRFVEARSAYEKLLKIDPKAEILKHDAEKALRLLDASEKSVDLKISEARQLGSSGDFSGALQSYEQIIAFTPDARATVAPEMAQCYVKRATNLAKIGQPLNAAADAEAAMRLDPQLADKLEKFYSSCALPGVLNSLTKGDIASARVDLKRVLEFVPNSRSALYVSGRLEESLGNFAGAAGAYASGLGTRVENATRQVTAELRKKLEEQEHIDGSNFKIDTTFAELTGYAATANTAQKLETENFIIIHYNNDVARDVATRAEADRQRIVSELKASPWKGKVKVYLHRTQAEYTARTGQPEWTGGSSKVFQENGKLSEPQIHSWQTSPRLLTSVLPHEITHVIVNYNISEIGVLPKCLHEGFAVLMEPKFRKDYFMNFLRMRFKSRDFIPLNELLTAKDYPRDPDFFYAEGYALLQFLVQQKGIDAATSIFKLSSASKAPAEILRIAGAQSLENFESDWKNWISQSR